MVIKKPARAEICDLYHIVNIMVASLEQYSGIYFTGYQILARMETVCFTTFFLIIIFGKAMMLF